MKKAGDGRLNWGEDEERRELDAFCGKLNEIGRRSEEEIDAEAILFVKGENRGVINIFGHVVSHETYTLLLILRDDIYISDRAIMAGKDSDKFKRELSKMIRFLNHIPGIRFPEVPDFLRNLVKKMREKV